ncbi:uncharacterized protein LOC113768025 isoform X2 [Coffea eugenioides]|uniref:Uncharacterized protein isoform X2 n=1 Tax=Coffea arabica TaxID=13443 RepID=A0ABM4U6L4_COFAR|nr:uncharacterized protein LOC113768025 isoform X2 [Coffea eugenioides]
MVDDGGLRPSWNPYTMGVILVILATQFVRWCSARFRFTVAPPNLNPKTNANVAVSPSSAALSQPRTSSIVSDSDLKDLLHDLDEKLHENEEWEPVIDRRNHFFSYTAKSCKPKDGPLKYLSITVFENCSSELLRNFYMDNNYRKTWDKTLMEHEQLQVDESNGTEIGRTIKKFPFLTPREYVSAWRVWEDKYGAFYCLSKGCEHALAPRQKKYVRVMFLRSGWRIRKAGRNACEIKMVHQEDAGLNVEMAKLVFAKSIWSYVCRMSDALHIYSPQLNSSLSATMLTQKFPPGMEGVDDTSSAASTICCQVASDCYTSNISRKPANKLIKNGLILLGGAVCLSGGHSDLGAKVAMAYILTKLTKHGALSRLRKAGKH